MVMKTYRKRPERFYAKQFRHEDPREEWPEGVFIDGEVVFLHTASGRALVSDGDYIVKDMTGNVYPVPEAVWDATTEEVEL